MPLFEVHVERRTWNVHQDNSTNEVVVDRGQVVANDRSSSICEMELELKDGNADALFPLARQINAVVPLCLGVLTKSERGYQLSRSLSPAVNKAGSAELSSGNLKGKAAAARSHEVIGAGVATSPNFPRIQSPCREARFSSSGRIRFRWKSCDLYRYLLGYPV